MTEQMGLLRPAALALLLVVPLAAALLALAARRRRRALLAFAGRTAALVARSEGRQRVKAALLLAAAAVAVLGLAGPYVDQRSRSLRHLGIDLVIAVDTSQSMATRDVPVDRLRVARDAVDTIARRMDGSRIALVLFANEAVVRYPATTDASVLAAALDNSARGYRLPAGSSLRAGLAAAAGAFPESAPGGPRQALVVISDGEYPNEDAPDVRGLIDRGIRVFSLAIGTSAGGQIPTYDAQGKATGFLRGADGQPVTSRMQEEKLRAIAAATNGRFWQHVGADTALDDLVRELHAMDTATIESDAGLVPDDRYQVLVLIALALLLAEWLVDDRRPMPAPRGSRPAPRARRRLQLGPIGLVIVAFTLGACSDAVFEQNRAANTLYARGDARAALARYRDLQRAYPEHLAMLSVNAGNALHRLGEHARAVSEYELALDGDARTKLNAHYGRGSSLFRQGKLDEARDAFIDALRVDPGDRDSKFNIEVIDLMRRGRPGQPQTAPGQGNQGQQGQQPQPGQGSQPGQQPGQGPGQPGQQPGSQPGQGDPSSSGAAGPSLDRALLEFRRNLTEEEALQVLDALRSSLRGVEGLIEGAPRAGDRRDPY